MQGSHGSYSCDCYVAGIRVYNMSQVKEEKKVERVQVRAQYYGCLYISTSIMFNRCEYGAWMSQVPQLLYTQNIVTDLAQGNKINIYTTIIILCL